VNTTADSPRSLEQWQRQLEATFGLIQATRMQGVPVMNTALAVCADVFTRWDTYYLGVMVTPWFMNLMLLPATEESREQFAARRTGQKQNHAFPAGTFEFITGHEPELGCFQSCSLFSPMFDFRDQEAALDTARAVLEELMNANNLERLDAGGNRIAPPAADAASGDAAASTPAADDTSSPQAPPPRTALSRRELLMGGRR
jgi:[NiFe] hydrogenase assembly HybE family chaperone